MLMAFNNSKNLNEERLKLFEKISKHTILTLMAQCDEGVLSDIKSNDELKSVLVSMDQVLASKLRTKFDI